MCQRHRPLSEWPHLAGASPVSRCTRSSRRGDAFLRSALWKKKKKTAAASCLSHSRLQPDDGENAVITQECEKQKLIQTHKHSHLDLVTARSSWFLQTHSLTACCPVGVTDGRKTTASSSSPVAFFHFPLVRSCSSSCCCDELSGNV